MPKKTSPELDAFLSNLAREACPQGEAVDRAIAAHPMTGTPTDEERRKYRERLLNLYKSRRKLARAAARAAFKTQPSKPLGAEQVVEAVVNDPNNVETALGNVAISLGAKDPTGWTLEKVTKLASDLVLRHARLADDAGTSPSCMDELIFVTRQIAESLQTMVAAHRSVDELLAAKDATIETQRRLIDRLERMVGAA